MTCFRFFKATTFIFTITVTSQVFGQYVVDNAGDVTVMAKIKVVALKNLKQVIQKDRINKFHVQFSRTFHKIKIGLETIKTSD